MQLGGIETNNREQKQDLQYRIKEKRRTSGGGESRGSKKDSENRYFEEGDEQPEKEIFQPERRICLWTAEPETKKSSKETVKERKTF